MAKNNSKIFAMGNIKPATKEEVVAFNLGRVEDLEPVAGVIEKDDDGTVRIRTKENPDGTVYDQNDIAVVRILDGRVRNEDGMYDIYAVPKKKADSMFRRPVEIDSLLNETQKLELAPILDSGSNIVAALTLEEPGRRVIIITPEMIAAGCDACYNEWDPDTPCHLLPGDVFLVSDEENGLGYRIGKAEFWSTHKLD